MDAKRQFQTAAEFYDFREPYPPGFFRTMAERLALTGNTNLLDVGCGPGNLALGFAPYVGARIAVDSEPEMLRAARSKAAAADLTVMFIETRLEDLKDFENFFSLVTIGRALHWLAREPALAVFDRIVAPGGRLAVCGSDHTDAPENAWVACFKDLRRRWAAPDFQESHFQINEEDWFASSRFRKAADILVLHRQQITIDDIIKRALSFSVISPQVLGDRRPEFETELSLALQPFAAGGILAEELAIKATVFA